VVTQGYKIKGKRTWVSPIKTQVKNQTHTASWPAPLLCFTFPDFFRLFLRIQS
jgi:hypothetical protein